MEINLECLRKHGLSDRESERARDRDKGQRRLFESLSGTVTCTRELISICMCYSQGDGLNTSLSRLFHLVYWTSASVVIWLSGCPLVPCLCTVPSTLCIRRSCEWYMNYVYLCISSLYVTPNINSTPVPEC